MKISKNDPRLTAYVLNELDALEKSIIESALKGDTELQIEVAQIKKSIGVFNTLAQTQTESALSEIQRDKIFEKPASSPAWSLWTLGGSLATASLALILFQQKAHEKKEFIVSVPITESVSAAPKKAAVLAKKQKVKVEQSVPSEMNVADDSLQADQPAALAAAQEYRDAKREEHQELETAKNRRADGLGASAGAVDFGTLSKAKSAVLARPATTARMAKDEMPPPPESPTAAEPTQARARYQELPLQLDVSLSQFLPTESEPADVEINMNLTRDLKKCFLENLSKYVRYNLKFRLNWSVRKARPENVQISDLMNTGLITTEIRSCVKQSFESQNWSEVKNIREALKPLQFEAVVSIVSE